jgi:lipoate-protein ligase A
MFNIPQWRYIDTGIASAAWNMAVDEALLYGWREGDLPVLRLYEWMPSLSFGRFSSVAESVDPALLAQEKIGAVRRLTGGGILVHGGDVSYAMIMPRAFLDGRGVKESYRLLSAFLLRLYQTFGLSAAFAHDLALEEKHSPICLAGQEDYDIIVAGRKMGGNAQRYTRRAFLQHGSIPLYLERGRFERLFSEPSGLENAASLERCGITLTPKALKEAVVKAICDTFGAETAADVLRPEEETCARDLLRRKYEKEEWNIHATNPFMQA